MTENFAGNAAETINVAGELATIEDVASRDEVANLITNFAAATGALYSTVKAETEDERMEVYGAIAGAGKIDDVEGETLLLKNFIIQAIELTDEETGELVSTTRVVLITEDGSAYAGISKPLVQGLQLLTQLVGHPSTWSTPKAVVVDRITTRKGFKAFNIVPAHMGKRAQAAKNKK